MEANGLVVCEEGEEATTTHNTHTHSVRSPQKIFLLFAHSNGTSFLWWILPLARFEQLARLRMRRILNIKKVIHDLLAQQQGNKHCECPEA